MYTTHHPAGMRRTGAGLPDELPLDFASIATAFESLSELMAKSGITENRSALSSRRRYCLQGAPLSSCEGALLRNWDRIVSKIKGN